MLKFVRDIMHTGEAIPIKPLGTKMSDALVEMSSKGFGCVCIVDASGEIAGIITDGDLRRHMRPDLMTASVDDVMTKNPRTIAPGMLASEIMLESINSSKPAVMVLIVAEGNKPVGIVHVHDVLRAGVGVNRRLGIPASSGNRAAFSSSGRSSPFAKYDTVR